MMRNHLKHNESGQFLIMALLFFTIILIVGFIAIDFGLWLTQRNNAQKDSDAAVLAGAQAYLLDLADTGGATGDARQWAELNGIEPDRIEDGTLDCPDGMGCIAADIDGCREEGDGMPWVEAKIRRDGPSLFTSVLGSFVPDIGADARACVGSARSMTGLHPYGIQTDIKECDSNDPPEQCVPCPSDPTKQCTTWSDCLKIDEAGNVVPKYGAVCVMKVGSQDSMGGQRGQLQLGHVNCSDKGDMQDLEDDFTNGVPSECSIGDIIHPGQGNIVGHARPGLQARLENEWTAGTCDGIGPGVLAQYDEFTEVFSMPGGWPEDAPVVPSPDNAFALNQCTYESGDIPRAVTLVLIDKLSGGGSTATITGFAGFYIVGCYDQGSGPNQTETIKQLIQADLTNFSLYLNRCETWTGQTDIVGIFVQTVVLSGNVGTPDENLPLSIILVK